MENASPARTGTAGKLTICLLMILLTGCASTQPIDDDEMTVIVLRHRRDRFV